MSTPTRGYNLLDNRLIASFLRSRWYPAIFQWVTSAAFVLIMWQLLVGPDSAHSNAGTALTWVLWWPVIPIIFVLMGRFWCAICPFAALSDAVQKLVGNHRRAPEFLKKYGIWIIDALFILITWSDHVWGIVESPWGSGILLLLLTTGVVISGAFFERRTWCRYLCFLGGLSGNYARVGMLELRAKPEVCATCTSRAACFNGSEQGRGCPLFEFPRTMDSSANCNLCASCIKVCPHNAITLTVRPPTRELWFIRKPKLEEAFLAVVIMGIVFIQNITMLELWQGLLAWLERSLGITSYPLIFTITFVIAMAAPVALMAGAAMLASRANGATAAANFARFGYAIIPLDVAGHIAHNLFHLLAEGKAVLFTTLALFGQHAGEQPTALLGTAQIQLLQYALVALGVGGSLYAALRIARSSRREGQRTWASFAPYAALIVLLGAINIYLFILPMASRM
ncbi:4Fe-4S binding protein [Chloroflexia bacterium SDU3-3]|nr:4Fe-4S binding protein [Chloroflexia bacterium SDU3-3]